MYQQLSKRKKTTTVVTTIYKLNDNIQYIETDTNGKISREIKYTGKTFAKDARYYAVYEKDLGLLSETNPFWFVDRKECQDFFKSEIPAIDDIDINRIFFVCSYNHSFWNINGEPIPVVQHFDYIHANIDNQYYKLDELRVYLSNHPNVIKCSEIRDIPYYNSEPYSDKYLDVFILPTIDMLKECYKNDWSKVIGNPYCKQTDFLNIKHFLKEQYV